MFGLYTQPTTYASTNPFLTGAYMSYAPGESSYADKFNTIGSTKDIKSFFESYASDSPSKYPTKLPTSYETDACSASESMYTTSKYNTIGSKYPEQKSSYLSSVYSTAESKYSPSKNGKLKVIIINYFRYFDLGQFNSTNSVAQTIFFCNENITSADFIDSLGETRFTQNRTFSKLYKSF